MKKILLTLTTLLLMTSTALATPRVVTEFVYPVEAPENATVDFEGNVYVSLGLDGALMKVDPVDGSQDLYAQLPLVPGCVDPVQFMTGVTIDPLTNIIYVNALSCDLDKRGTYAVYPPENPDDLAEIELLALVPAEALPNGITLFMGHLYTPDSLLGNIYRIPTSGLGEGEYAEVWLYDEHLLPGPPNPIGFVPGANGIQKFGLKLYIANSGRFTFLQVPFVFNSIRDILAGTPDPGTLTVYAETPSGGPDDFAFDIHKNIYYGTDPLNTVVKLSVDEQCGSSPECTIETVLVDVDTECDCDGAPCDCVDGATACVFDRWSKSLYVTMASFAFFPNKGTPSLVEIPNVAWGYPFR